MIYESRFWKDDLIKQANSLRAKTKQRRWTETSSARLEQAIMLGFYSIRKLIESQKLSSAVINQKISANMYIWKGKSVTRINWIKIDKLYDLEKPKTIRKDLLFFCHQFVHSYVFCEYFEEITGFIEGVFVSSDRERNRNLYSLSISQIIALFEQIGNDYPDSFALVYNPEKKDYELKDYVVEK
jgi:hypothetical protein